MALEKRPLRGNGGRRPVALADNEQPHRLEQRRQMVLEHDDVAATAQSERRELAAQFRERPLEHRAGDPVRAVQVDVALADADEKVGVFLRGGVGVH